MPRISSIVGLVLAVGAAGWIYITKDFRYLEQVQLSSGEVIQVERVIEANRIGEIGGPGGVDVKFNSLTVSSPSKTAPPTWESEMGLVPLLLDRDARTGDWYLVATFYMCEPWRALGKPKLPYAAFRASGRQWERIPLAPDLIGREANVLTVIRSNGERPLVNLAEKQARNSDPAIDPSYLRIVPKWTSGC